MRIPPPIVVLVDAGILYACHHFLPVLKADIPDSWFIGGLIIVVGVVINLFAAGLFGRRGTTVNPIRIEEASKLVTDGLFRYSRNPMYLGMALFLLGFGIGLQTWATPFIVIGFVIYMNIFQIAPEERAMEKLFGAEYAAYKARVRRWF